MYRGSQSPPWFRSRTIRIRQEHNSAEEEEERCAKSAGTAGDASGCRKRCAQIWRRVGIQGAYHQEKQAEVPLEGGKRVKVLGEHI